MTSPNASGNWVVYLGTFPPRECGIATFTEDLTAVFDDMYEPRQESRVIAMNTKKIAARRYPKKVIAEITDSNVDDYLKAAELVNQTSEIKLVNIQHEYGLFGGEYGSHLLHFMEKVEKPLVLTLHTILPGPNETLRTVTSHIIARASLVVVMTETSKKILVEDYAVPADKIRTIPHGIHSSPYTPSLPAKKGLKLQGKMVISTFGLLSSGKGIEYGIEALPEVVKKFPNVVYLIIGATHPIVLKEQGEAYRESLEQKVKVLGLEDHVLFYNRYYDLPDLLQVLRATDIYMALSLNPNQAVSGTLSYALGTGRPVISTKFAQAREDVSSEVGILVDFKKPEEITAALLTLLEDEGKRISYGQTAYFRTRRMEWRNVIISYMNEYISLAPELGKQEKNMPKINMQHFMEMTDDFGMFQFAKLTVPDPQWGYTLDDNARALMAAVIYYEKKKDTTILPYIETYLNFISFTSDDDHGFKNYVNHDKSFNLERNSTEGLEDTTARAFYALARTAASMELPATLKHKAIGLFKHQFAFKKTPVSPRALALYVKAFDLWLHIEPSVEMEERIKRYCDTLLDHFKDNNLSEWHWFESILSYSNGILPEALLIGFRRFNVMKYFEVAQQALDFLINSSFKDDICMPIGQDGWMSKNQGKQTYDQQPEEVAALVSVLKKMFEATQDVKYKKKMIETFNWFLGNNILHQVVYDQGTGGCYDGIGEHQVNLNQGAESTVTYLLSRLIFE